MRSQRWFVFAFKTFCEGCKHYYKALLAMGLAPTNAYSEETLLANRPDTAQSGDATGLMSMTETYVLKGLIGGGRSATSIASFSTMYRLDKMF